MPTKQRLTKQNIKQANILDSTKEHNPLLDYLAKHHPQTISEERLNLDALSQALGFSPSSMQGYGLSFIGKPLANALYSTPTTKELKELDPKHSQNIIIKGDNLHALKLLKSAYDGKIKMIYIDPPYNTKNEKFIYDDNFVKEYQKLLIELDLLKLDSNGKVLEKSEVLHFLTNPSGDKTHSGWLAFMLPRLKLARDLLKDDGVIFISIDDNEQANLKILCDEIFGEENFVANLCVELSTTQGMKVASAQKGQIVKNAEYILCYAKDNQNFKFERPLYTAKEWDDHYSVYIDPESKNRTTLLEFLKDKYPDITKQKIEELYNNDKDFRDYIHANAKDVYRDAMIDINFNFTKKQEEDIENGNIISYKEYLIFKTSTGVIRQLLPLEKAIGETDDFEAKFGLRKIRGDWWEGYYKDMMNINKEGDVIFKNGKKPMRLIKDILKISTNTGGGGGDIVLDFFAGSGTTAQAVMELNAEDGGNRQFILVQLDEPINEAKSKVAYDFCKNTLKSQNPVISDITIERVKRAAAKIAKQDLLSTKELDLDFRLFTMVQKPELVSKENDSLGLITHADLSPQDKALNLALQDSKMLHKKLESIIKDKLYQCENSLYIVQMDKEVLDYIKNKTHDEIIYLNAFDDINLQEYLNLESHLKTRLYVVFQ
ncbi:site-specific DNA-methyltransferase [uncultured Campylobacter sp.]|uniref:site-specific DNA-methyltransferase n=1 Tax=uncultured Campylobacter sp. TaxID=218934 RepID=UPI0026371776